MVATDVHLPSSVVLARQREDPLAARNTRMRLRQAPMDSRGLRRKDDGLGDDGGEWIDGWEAPHAR
jgi:hypothetical protein